MFKIGNYDIWMLYLFNIKAICEKGTLRGLWKTRHFGQAQSAENWSKERFEKLSAKTLAVVGWLQL